MSDNKDKNTTRQTAIQTQLDALESIAKDALQDKNDPLVGIVMLVVTEKDDDGMQIRCLLAGHAGAIAEALMDATKQVIDTPAGALAVMSRMRRDEQAIRDRKAASQSNISLN